MRNFKNESGFSLVAVMGISVVLGLVSVLVIAVVTHMFRNSAKANVDVLTRDISVLAQALITNANFCDSALRSGPLGTATAPPGGTARLGIVNPGALNPTGAVQISSLEMPGGVGVVWINQAVPNFPSAIVSDIRFSSKTPTKTSALNGGSGFELDQPADQVTYTDPVGTVDIYDRYRGFVNIWFAVTAAGGNAQANPRPVSFPLTLLVGRNPAKPLEFQKVVHCTGSDSFAQICWEMGGVVDDRPGNNYRCINTILQNIMANPYCNATSPGMIFTACLGKGFSPGATTGSTTPVETYGCGPLYHFVGFTPGSVPQCVCTPMCY